ncbi:MAG TPA: zf-HC2 domain-containing protein [Thermoanaerobaculia bacterium]|nr:zf-HC2 domain-containing protein [Thermoanaerobaculia bacterium]
MDCREVNEAIYRFFDNELEEALLATFRIHVDGCSDCAKRVSYTRTLLWIVRERCARCSAPDHLRLRILHSMAHRQNALGPH